MNFSFYFFNSAKILHQCVHLFDVRWRARLLFHNKNKLLNKKLVAASTAAAAFLAAKVSAKSISLVTEVESALKRVDLALLRSKNHQ